MAVIMQKELCVPLCVDFIRQTSDFLDSCLIEVAADISPKQANRLHIAVDEVASNLSAYSGASEVCLRFISQDGEIALTFFDDGIPYDPFSAPFPDTVGSAAERPIGGLGLLLVKRLMNDVHYERRDGQNVLTLCMHIDGCGSKGDL